MKLLLIKILDYRHFNDDDEVKTQVVVFYEKGINLMKSSDKCLRNFESYVCR